VQVSMGLRRKRRLERANLVRYAFAVFQLRKAARCVDGGTEKKSSYFVFVVVVVATKQNLLLQFPCDILVK